MSTDTQEQMEMGTKPIAEHAWLNNLIGEWKTEAEFSMGSGMPLQKTQGTETTKSLGGLWAISEGKATLPDGKPMTMYTALGYDVSFEEYRGCWYASMSSHLWTSVGTLSADGKKMTLNCVGPSMTKDGETANYRDVIELIDNDHRTLTSFGQDDNGEWHEHMKVRYTRV